MSDTGRLIRAAILLLLGLCVATGSAISDVYLHRGIESGNEAPIVVHPTGKELATNVDLSMYSPDQIENIAKVLKTNNFTYVRQLFAWSDIEPVKGQYVWDRYDPIVQTLSAHKIKVVAVLARTPGWARNPDQTGYTDAPPVDSNDFGAFAFEFVDHYKGAVEYVQIWDLPNNPARWGGLPATALDFAALLAAGFNGARGANSEAKIVLAELDPRGGTDVFGQDLVFLNALYATGAAAFFDIVALQIDGGSSSPYDRKVSAYRENLSRAILLREEMVARGDGAKPIWLTRYGWKGESGGGSVSEQERGDYQVAGLKRARAEWPWMGLMFAWGLLPSPDGSDAGYTLLNGSGAATPTFNAVSEFGQSGVTTVASTGYVSMDSAPVTFSGAWADQHLVRQTFKTSSETGASASLRFRGTGVTAILRRSRQAGPIYVTLDGKPLPGWPVENGAAVIVLDYYQAEDIPILLADGLDDGEHTLQITLAEEGQLTLGGLIVSRDPPLLWPVILLMVIAAAMLFMSLRDVVFVFARRSGYLQDREGIELRPPLPKMPNWRPATRYR